MKKNIFSEKYGKEVPYKVPAEFFETITEKTLQEAKKRNRKAKVRILTVWTSAAAVVLVIMMLAGLNMSWFGGRPQIETVVQVEAELPEMEPIENQASVSDSSHEISREPDYRKQDSVSDDPEEYDEETLENLLASLTEEELQIVFGQISAELYLNELIEE